MLPRFEGSPAMRDCTEHRRKQAAAQHAFLASLLAGILLPLAFLENPHCLYRATVARDSPHRAAGEPCFCGTNSTKLARGCRGYGAYPQVTAARTLRVRHEMPLGGDKRLTLPLPHTVKQGDEFGAAMHAALLVDVAHVRLDGGLRKAERLAYRSQAVACHP